MARVSIKQQAKKTLSNAVNLARRSLQPRVVSPVPQDTRGKIFTAPSMSNLRGNIARIKQEFGAPGSARAYVKEFGNVASGRTSILGNRPGAQSYVPRVVRPVMNVAGGLAESVAKGPANVVSGAIGGRPKQVASGAIRTGLTFSGARAMTPAFGIVGGGLGAANAALQRKSISQGFGQGLGEAINTRGLTRFTDPFTLGTSGVAKSLTQNKIGQQLIGRTISGFGNTAEDYVLSKLEGYTPKLRDHLLSFGFGALISSGGTKADWDNLLRRSTAGLKGQEKKQAIELIQDARGRMRESQSGKFAQSPNVNVTFSGGNKGILPRTQRQLLRKQYPSDVFGGQAPQVKSYFKQDIASGLLGAQAGWERDENGDWRYNPAKGAFGAAAGVGASRQFTGRNIKLGLGTEDISKDKDNLLGKERGFISNVKGSQTAAPELKTQLGETQNIYDPITNKQTIQQAKFNLDTEGWDASKKRVFDEPLSAETNILGQQLIKRAQDEGRYDEAIDIVKNLAKKGTEAGQAVQSFSVWGKLTPEGMLKYAINQVDTAKQQMGFATKTARKVFGADAPEIKPEDAKIITDLMKKAQVATSEQEQADYARAALEHIGKKIPWGVSDVIDEYRYNNMLSGPLTHLRNLYSNVLQSTIVRPATLAAQGKVSDAVRYEKAALQAVPKAFVKAMDVFKTGKKLQRLDDVMSAGASQFKPKRLGKLYNIPSSALEASDTFFTTLIRQGELARGATPEQAEKAANYWVFRQGLNDKKQGVLLNSIDNMTKGIYSLRKVGLGWVIPFLQTPMNVAKQGLEFSPAGVLTTIGAKNKGEQLAKAGLGSIAALVGASLAMEDRTTWDVPKDPSQKELFYAAGKKPYSVKIGDTWVPMQYLGPFAWSVGLPAAYKHFQEDSRTALTDSQLQKLMSASMSGAKFWSQQTFMQGLGQFVKLAEGDTDYDVPKILSNFASQLNPMTSLQRYVTQIVDPVFRKAGGDTLVEKVTQQLQTGIPGQSQKLEAYTNPLGEESKRNLSNYVAPWGMGKEDTRFTGALDTRERVLQSNAFAAKIQDSYEPAIEKVSTQISKDLENQILSGMDLTPEQRLAAIEKIQSRVRAKVKKKVIKAKSAEIANQIKQNWGDTPEQKAEFLKVMKSKGLLTEEVLSALLSQ